MGREALKRKRKIILTVVVSLLFLGCIFGESYKRGYIGNEAKKDGNGKKLQETVETVGDKKSSKSSAEEEDKIIKAVKKENDIQKVRVLLSVNGFQGYYHDSISLTCKHEFTVTVDNKKKNYKAGQKVSYNSKNTKLKGKKITITPSKGKIEVLSLLRQNIHPSYRGSLSVTWKKSGLLLVNTLPVEEYLYAVVPSELSSAHKLEALKAQAVCARSFTYNQIEQGRFGKYGADVDDSVSCQVYNNNPEDEKSIKAVDGTKDLVMTSGGRIIVAYYFSTSWGYTASGKEVWNTEKEVPYLKKGYQGKSGGADSIESEAVFNNFIKSGGTNTYDSKSEWYRWTVEITAKALGRRIMSVLSSCQVSNAENVLIQKKDGSYCKGKLKQLGAIKKIRVEKREESGIVTELVIVGKKQVVKVRDQYNIRKVLAPVSETIVRTKGGDVKGYSMLPSAAFTVVEDIKKNKTISFIIRGGGFGHGCGMSQEGAAQMAENGAGYQKILKHYFSGVKLQNISKVKK